MRHEVIEKNSLLMAVLVICLISVGGLVEITPLFFLKSTIPPLEGVRPYAPLELEGRDIYIREGCYNCHSQMIRPFRAETERYGPYSKPAESMYDHPFQWGSKRTGPDLARIGKKYPDSWHVQHMEDPRSLVPESVMPRYPWLSQAALDDSLIQKKMQAMKTLGVPYTDEEIRKAPEGLKGKTELDAIIAYLQSLGTAVKRQ
ncbi:MAG: cytochrome-c oxidase, cbb3-type subunit II [Deltaproteobacteria bacterium]|nr:cytochrome-c oxidase, cbb3-type subunit II [Deltaproteobacteria bacterium]